MHTPSIYVKQSSSTSPDYRQFNNAELALLFRCLSVEIHDHGSEEIRSAVGEPNLNWDRFLSLLRRHRLVQQVYGILKKLPENSIEQARLQQLKALSLKITLTQLSNVAQLAKVIQEFDRLNIQYITLKGATLGSLLYGSPEKRQSNDIDILVSEQNLHAAESALLQLGFQYDEVDSGRDEDKFSAHRNHTHHLHFSNGTVVVELHWIISGLNFLYPKSFDELYESRQYVPIAGSNAATLDYEDLVCQLVLHGTAHCWNRLKLIYEIALLRKQNPNRFDALNEHSSARQMKRCIQTCHALSYQLFGYGNNTALHQLDISLLAKLARAQMFAKNSSPGYAINTLNRSAFILLSINGFRNQIRYLQNLFSWTQLHHTLKLPKPLRFLYAVLGPILWIGRSLLRSFHGSKSQ